MGSAGQSPRVEPGRLLRVALLCDTVSVAAAGGSVFAQNPFAWDTVQDKLYSFCSNASGALAPDALAALGKSKMMIHGMEEGAALPPVWQNSEAKIGLAAAQLRAVNPSQLQLYTVQIVRMLPHTARAARSFTLFPCASHRSPLCFPPIATEWSITCHRSAGLRSRSLRQWSMVLPAP